MENNDSKNNGNESRREQAKRIAEERVKNDKTTPQIAVILNASYMFMLVMTALFYGALFTDLGTDGTMRWVVALTMIIICDLAFAVIGVSLSVARKRVEISAGNLFAVWLAIPTLTTPAYPDLYADLLGFFPTDAQIATTALCICALLIAWTWWETIPLWKRANRAMDDISKS